MKVQFNLGLNNNNFNRYQSQILIENVFDAYKAGKYSMRYEMGEFIGSDEPTLVGEFVIGSNVDVKAIFRALADIFTQECIAIKIDGIGSLEFRNDYTGERYQFDEKYFINY